MLLFRLLGLSWRTIGAILALALVIMMWRIYLTSQGVKFWRV